MLEKLIQKYNVPVPRYTSYPTAPYWRGTIDALDNVKSIMKEVFINTNEDSGISIYLHLPYCESMCTFCACTRVITKNHNVEKEYIESILKEWKTYIKLFKRRPIVRELHLGGGTPTFFSPSNLTYLITEILKYSTLHEQYSFSFEAHPGVTSKEHLQALYEVGFRRVSFGVQDFDPKVQEVINRSNDFKVVKKMTDIARSIGYQSINFDLVYGLPKQKISSIENTLCKVAELRPNRIAFYSYAHVPWKMKAQRLFSDDDLPDNVEKRSLYEKGKKMLLDIGYFDIGMDHFSLDSDDLYIAYKERRLHRNFMGYNTSHTKVLVGLGASAISDFDKLYVQNNRDVNTYKNLIANNGIAFNRSYILDENDLVRKRAILDLSCKRYLILTDIVKSKLNEVKLQKMQEMQEEGLLDVRQDILYIEDLGMVFLRNICSLFDEKYEEDKKLVFSKSI